MRLICRTLFTLAVVGTAAYADDLKATATKAYASIASGVEKRDTTAVQKALHSIATSDFVFFDPFSMTHDADGYSALLVQLALPNGKQTKRFQIVSIKQKGDKATLSLRSETDGKPKVVRTTEDIWVRQKGMWKLRHVQYTAPVSSLGIRGGTP